MSFEALTRSYLLWVNDALLNQIAEFENNSNWFSYRAKGFFGFVLRSPKPIEQFIHQFVPVLATPRISKTESGSSISGFVFTIREIDQHKPPKVELDISTFPGHFGLIDHALSVYVFNDVKKNIRGYVRVLPIDN